MVGLVGLHPSGRTGGSYNPVVGLVGPLYTPVVGLVGLHPSGRTGGPTPQWLDWWAYTPVVGLVGPTPQRYDWWAYTPAV